MKSGKLFSKEEANLLEEIILNRRDVRGNHFLNKTIEKDLLDKLLFSALNAPSVGFSQPWEFIIIKNKTVKEKIKQSFDEENHKAIDHFQDKKQKEYIKLKLEGIIEAPINIAVFYKPSDKPVLGQTSMSKMGLYSVVCAVQNMWLTARSLNIGMGWVSILNEEKVKAILNVPKENKLVAYLCLGYVDKFYTQPELELIKWEKRKEKDSVVRIIDNE
ncbi:5,6-dimethylbenzimidazole synthase [Flavobacterium columnare NBRC 100251 = ATCC 23463]|uniref:Nitroreductase n=2 Tax=Flavobacterium columnare TaxID=996 RepID=G8X4A7_FLACA|nr:5,6-dimethylbenzimidazole synthase [Flavobacterium columnare]AEW85332.1 Nitroreductase [Flavobacterium columnare ATCC 49512]AMO19687.1 5,6-dimethylbenzimidazole synthase [Flavobacterium columnare]ANO48886.1 Nitroreductase [Flavobacterium columnare]APT23094.1 5,6-dimethylbenzimidazole synthase [Flavobacterium columnare]AUX17619.1 5,6-dimethylbenzimidazole synthase [Flavobacterium columnare]